MERTNEQSPRGEKIYAGLYTYWRNQNEYLEEFFEVFRNHQDLSLTFYTDIHGKVITGEILKICVDYKVGKDFIPELVVVRKSLGIRSICETYRYKKDKRIIEYSFMSDEEKHEEEISTPSIFSIAAPCSCTSVLFIKIKTEDINNRNTYYTYRSFNKWKFKESPVIKPITIQRESTHYKTVTLSNNVSMQAIPYSIFESEKKSAITAYVSRHMAIPYLIEGTEGTKIQISRFSNFDREA